ncbi:hypothetical protein LNP05_22675 [Klebsiella pneumoniae subsp. pneumoniae]|nr:hypothetical protein [Klebsiella pneumoniae subsp. pneumoniae]
MISGVKSPARGVNALAGLPFSAVPERRQPPSCTNTGTRPDCPAALRLPGLRRDEPAAQSRRPDKARAAIRHKRGTVSAILPGGAALAGPAKGDEPGAKSRSPDKARAAIRHKLRHSA